MLRLNRTSGLLGLLALAACAHVTNEDQALCHDTATRPCYQPDDGYRFLPDKNAARDTLVVVTLSGGGIRASALAYGTLLALKELPGREGEGGTLLDQVDIISSVSGGSVTAGWYAWQGKDGLQPEEERRHSPNALGQFFAGGGNAAIAWRGLNPAAMAGYALTPYQRSDVLAGFFADRLFGGTTFAALDAKYRNDPNQPFVILNATDLGHESRFPFTQGQFDLICSDLGLYRLSDAVAASANFPIVFSPIGLQNYSRDCAAHEHPTPVNWPWAQQGPPHWINRYACYDGKAGDAPGPNGLVPVDGRDSGSLRSPRSNGLLELRWARSARDYITAAPGDEVIHLLDGGLVDNLGVLSTLAVEDKAQNLPGLFQRLNSDKQAPSTKPSCPDPDRDSYPERYQHIKEVLFIVVNARTRSPAGIDNSIYPPDVASTTLRVVDTPLDATILDHQNYLTAELQAILGQPAETAGPGRGNYDCNSAPQAGRPAPSCARIVSIDFETIVDKSCRDGFWTIATTWTLDEKTIAALIALPKIMLRRSGEIAQFYGDLDRIDAGKEKPGTALDKTGPLERLATARLRGFAADFTAPCAAVAAAQ